VVFLSLEPLHQLQSSYSSRLNTGSTYLAYQIFLQQALYHIHKSTTLYDEVYTVQSKKQTVEIRFEQHIYTSYMLYIIRRVIIYDFG
jgi:hypothetical protein